ncbi:maleylacetoacetate isomerase [Sphingomonas sp. Leaf407]|uniref:maleylacetoacetate isomerase n=1 Tax=unclassified Sphingomonas TaxID=196159 RepID=UPI0006FEF7F7|nr:MULTISPECIES: maleylacetoacetate isomerase [unclassified Sphingomonas]KQN37310.1 maleylacetoacetate isomerase [Sphingomonas sp. Leaf42]KQT27678.1 maleylacetoacetate isomerase [Sphingomonas sp. Leaf407]
MSGTTLHDYFRSSAGYRVRIALNLKNVAYERVEVSLLNGEQRSPGYLARNPQGLVPALDIGGGTVLTQSLAILDWLDHAHPEPRLFPTDPIARARAMAQALVIVADTHPIDNLRVLRRLETQFGADAAAKADWYRHWIAQGFDALEVQAPADGLFGGDTPNVVDCCLVPQCYNARRFDLDVARWPRLAAIDARVAGLPAIAAAHPDAVASRA